MKPRVKLYFILKSNVYFRDLDHNNVFKCIYILYNITGFHAHAMMGVFQIQNYDITSRLALQF